MERFARNLRRSSANFTTVQKLGICASTVALFSFFLSSFGPLVLFLVGLTGGWFLIESLSKLHCHIPEKYVFTLLEYIDEVEYVIKKFILQEANFKKSKPRSSTASTFLHLDNSQDLDNLSHRAPEHEAKICLQYIVRDFINSWYKEHISTENQPIEEAQEILEQITVQTIDRLRNVEALSLVKQVITRFHMHITDFQLAQEYWKQQPYFRSKRNREKPEFKKIKNLGVAFHMVGNVHPALKNETSQLDYLRSIVKVIMKTSLPNEAFKCDAARELLLEILTQNVLKSLLDLLSDTFFLHKVMVLVLTDDEVEMIDSASAEAENSVSSQDGTEQVFGQDEPLVEATSSGCQCDVQAPNDGTATSEDLDVTVQASEVLNFQFPDGAPEVCDATDASGERSHKHKHIKPQFFVGDVDTISVHSEEIDNDETSMRREPEGCLAPPDNSSVHNVSFIHSGYSYSQCTTGDAREPEDQDRNERKEIYRIRNQKWNPEEDIIVASPLTLFSDASTYGDTVDACNLQEKTQSAPNLQTLKIDYGPDLANIDPDCLIKETPRILFAGVHIPETDTAKEPGTASFYTLYYIEYVAWHFLAPIGRWTQQPGRVKRRFREFITLHERLLEHSIYRKSIKDIKGPNRWRAKPLGQLREKTVENRRKFLEQYLQILSKTDDVGGSFVLKEFLAYEADTRIAFVKKAPEMPRLDKMIVKTFSGMINKIATMPGAVCDAELPSPAEQKERVTESEDKGALSDTEPPGDDDKDAFDIDYDLWYPEEQREAHNNIESILWKTTYLVDTKATQFVSECDSVSLSETYYFDPDDFAAATTPRPEGDGCDKDQLDNASGPSDADIPLTVQVLNLAVQLADQLDAWVCDKNALRVFKIVIGRALDRFITEEVTDMTTSARCASYITKLRDVLWPNGVLDSEEQKLPSEEQRAATKTQARHALYSFFPAALPVIVGQDDFNHCVDVVMECIEHPELNRSFALVLFDLLVETIFPEIKTASFQQVMMDTSQETSDR